MCCGPAPGPSVAELVTSTVTFKRMSGVLVLYIASANNSLHQLTLTAEGYYQYINGWNGGPSNVWFSYEVKTRSATYLLVDCPQFSRDYILRRAQDDAHSFIFRPFMIDTILAKEYCWSWQTLIDEYRDELLQWVGLILTTVLEISAIKD